jgi:hypothetical protein
MRCIGFSAIAFIVAPGSRPTCCFLGISTECPEGTPTVVRATKGVVRFTGVSVSLNAVSGSSAGGMIDPRKTHNNPRITIVQRTRFTETPQIASQITRPAANLSMLNEPPAFRISVCLRERDLDDLSGSPGTYPDVGNVQRAVWAERCPRTSVHAFSVRLLCPTLKSAHLPRSVLSKAIGHLAVLRAIWRSRTWRRANSCLSRLKSTNKITTSPLQDLAFRLPPGPRQSRTGLQWDPRTQTPE